MSDLITLRSSLPFSISFFDDKGEIGGLRIVGGELTFEGNADSSAKLFFTNVIAVYGGELAEARDKALEEAAKVAETPRTYRFDDGTPPVSQPLPSGLAIAAGIRALKEKP